MRYGRLINI